MNTLAVEAVKVRVPEVKTRLNVLTAAAELEENAKVNCDCATHVFASVDVIAVTI